MLLSIIVPVYKVRDYLNKCVDSILAHNLVDFELILVDDCSPDECGAMCDIYAAHDSRIKVIHKQVNEGLSAARNAGLDVAAGDLVTFVDSDDFIEWGTFESLVRMFACDPELDMVEYSVYLEYGTARQSVYKPKYSEDLPPMQAWIEAEGYYHCYAWNKVYRRSLWDKVRFPVGKNYEDIFTIPTVIASARKIVASDEGLYYYVRHGSSISSSRSIANLTDFVNAEYGLFEKLLAEPSFTRISADRFYLRLANWQAFLLKAGGDMIIPLRKIDLFGVLASNAAMSLKLKAIAYTLLGGGYFNFLAKFFVK